MVMPTCSNGVDDMFEPDPWNFTTFAAECYKRWKVVPRPRWIVEEYGGKNISAASNIIFRLDDCSTRVSNIIVVTGSVVTNTFLRYVNTSPNTAVKLSI